jgi:hypothetical protein
VKRKKVGSWEDEKVGIEVGSRNAECEKIEGERRKVKG